MDSSDFLKPLDKVIDPDPLSVIFTRVDLSSGETHPKSLADHYDDVSALRLPNLVPERIRRHFDTARTVALYSWYSWRLRPVAELYGYASLEYALREKAVALGAVPPDSRMTFKPLQAEMPTIAVRYLRYLRPDSSRFTDGRRQFVTALTIEG